MRIQSLLRIPYYHLAKVYSSHRGNFLIFEGMKLTIEVKTELVAKCVGIIEQKLATIDGELARTQESANEETKSSAGDKYETGRAMLMLEKEKLAGQKGQLLQQLKPFKSMDVKKEMDTVELGALVRTNSSIFFISAGIGQVEVSGEIVLAVSAMAPIVQAMLGKAKGDQFEFNRNTFQILAVF